MSEPLVLPASQKTAASTTETATSWECAFAWLPISIGRKRHWLDFVMRRRVNGKYFYRELTELEREMYDPRFNPI